jgi:hypothetical protein
MTRYRRNADGIEKARSMIDAHQYVLDSDWSNAQPSASEENEKVDRDGYEAFGAWHLAIDTDASEHTKDRYGFVFGDFERVHRSGLIAAKQRAAEWDHTEIEQAADELLSHLDSISAKRP